MAKVTPLAQCLAEQDWGQLEEWRVTISQAKRYLEGVAHQSVSNHTKTYAWGLAQKLEEILEALR